jgi:hypothetical protein
MPPFELFAEASVSPRTRASEPARRSCAAYYDTSGLPVGEDVPMSLLTTEPLDVILRDGSTLRLRAPAPDDAAALLDFFGGLSRESLYRRFHGYPEIGPRLVEPLTSADSDEAGALVGCVDDRIVAVANFARLRDPKDAAARAARGPRGRPRCRALRGGGALR